MKRFLCCVVFLLVPLAAAQTPEIMIFGGDNHDVYLGCLSCSEYDSDSVFNEYGDYGSRYSSESIFNNFGDYGSRFSQYSPCNPFANDPPVIVDEDGNFYGYLTLSISKNQGIRGTDIEQWLELVVCAD